MNTGQNKSLTSEQKLQATNDGLDKYEQGIGLPNVTSLAVEAEAKRILNLEPSVLNKMSATECGESAFCLRQYSWYLQRSLNKERTNMKWAEESTKRTIAATIHNYRGVSYEERKMQAVKDNDVASNLDTLRIKAQLKIDRISFLADKIGDMAKSLESLQFTKRGKSD